MYAQTYYQAGSRSYTRQSVTVLHNQTAIFSFTLGHGVLAIMPMSEIGFGYITGLSLMH